MEKAEEIMDSSKKFKCAFSGVILGTPDDLKTEQYKKLRKLNGIV